MIIQIRCEAPRPRPREGDRRVDRQGRVWVRRQVYSERDRAYRVAHGRPVFEWVQVADLVGGR